MFRHKEDEQRALAEMALADFAAKEGMSIEGGTAHAALKSMGPTTEG